MNDKQQSRSEPTERASPTTHLSPEATMVGHLMSCGWKLHLSGNPVDGHAIFKSEIADSTTTIKRCDVSADCVLELQKAGRLKKSRQFTVGHKKTTVFELIEGEAERQK